MNAAAELTAHGQSVWLDTISRDMLESGDLVRYIETLGVVGVTSNPTIFAQALRSSSRYDAEVAELATQGLDDREVFARIAANDIRAACDALAGVYESSNGVDGMVSIELEPDLANDTAASIVRAHELVALVDRPNVMIKVPATDAGIPVVEELVAAGINVNVTLLFSVGVYRDVMDAYLRGLELRHASGLAIDRQASVASFFVSRVDTAIDGQLPDGHTLRGRMAVANAVLAWEAYSEVFGSERFAALAEYGARPQRPLWASTGTKNSAYSDVLYVQELIVPGTVNTMPLSTLEAFVDHGAVRTTIDQAAIDRAHSDAAELAATGIDLDEVTDTLRADGVASFIASYDELLSNIAHKRAQFVTA